MSKHLFSKSLTALFLGSLLAGCGGGGSSSTGNTPPAATNLSGTAAVGFPIVGATVSVTCAAGSAITGIANTTASGAWSATLTGQTLPCAVSVTGGMVNTAVNTTTYRSIANGAGTVNVTPLTSMIVANLIGSSSTSPSATQLAAITQTQINTALTNVQTALGATLPTNINPITTAFSPTGGVVMDDVLTAMAAAMTSSGTSYTALLNSSAGTAPNAAITPPAGYSAALVSAYAGTASGGSGAGGGGVTTCSSSHYSVPVHAPSATELAVYAKTYTGNVGNFGPNIGDPFVSTGSASFVLSAAGGLTYNGATKLVTSMCLENTPTTGAPLYVEMQPSDHVDFFTDSGFTGTLANGASFSVVRGGSCTTICGSGGGATTPTVASFTPTTGAVSTSMTITGTNLSAVTDVLFTGPSPSTAFVSGVIGTNTATSITTTVPASLTAGSYSVSVVHPGGEVVATGTFTVTAVVVGGAPVITGFSPASGAGGTVVTITGTNIDLINGAAPYVNFGTKLVMPTSLTSTSITADVPSNLLPKPATLTPSQYSISVNGVNGGTAIPVGTFTLTTTAVVPAIPSGVTATPISTSQVNLSWTAVPGAAGYYVYRSTAAGVAIATGNYVTGSATTTANLTTGHLASTAYYYKVTAVNAAGESAGSAEVTATTLAAVPPSAPTLITAMPISATQINLSWPAVAGATAYRVYRNTTMGFTVVKMDAGGYGDLIGQTSATTFNDVGSVIARALFPSNTPYYSTVTNYYYKVTAVNAYGESVESPEVAATTLNGPAVGVGITVAPAFKNLLAFAGSAPTTSTLTPAVGIAQFQYRQTSPNTAKDFLDVTHMVGTTATTVSIQINVGSPMASACASCEKGTTFAQTGLTCTITGTTTLSAPACSGLGIAFNQVAGTLTFTNTVFTYAAQATTHTVNGTLSFTPF